MQPGTRNDYKHLQTGILILSTEMQVDHIPLDMDIASWYEASWRTMKYSHQNNTTRSTVKEPQKIDK